MKGSQIKIGAILSYIVIALNMIIGIAYTPFLTKMLGQSEYGLYSLIASIISYLTILDLGFGSAITIYTAKYIAKNDKENEQKLHGMFLIIYTIIGIIAGIIGIILYLNVDNLFGNTMTLEELSTAKILMAILAFNLAITFPFSIYSSIITAYEKFIFSKLVNIIRIVLMPVIMIPLLLMGHKSISLVILTTVLNIMCLLINMWYCIAKLQVKFKFKGINFKVLKEIFGYSFLVFLNAIIDRINWSVDNFVLGVVSGTTAVSVYAVASQFNSAYISFSTAISGVMLPKISKMEAQKSSDKEFSDIFIKVGRIQYIIMAIVMTGFLIFGKQFIAMLFGDSYSNSYYIACILMLPISLPLIQNVGLNILKAKNKYKFSTIILFVIAIANVIISIPLAKAYEGIGSATATALSFVVGQIIIMNIYYYKKVNIDIPKFWKEIAKMTVPVVITTLIGILICKILIPKNMIIYIFNILLYCIIYISLMWKLGMNKEERQMFSSLLKSILVKFKIRRNNI